MELDEHGKPVAATFDSRLEDGYYGIRMTSSITSVHDTDVRSDPAKCSDGSDRAYFAFAAERPDNKNIDNVYLGVLNCQSNGHMRSWSSRFCCWLRSLTPEVISGTMKPWFV